MSYDLEASVKKLRGMIKIIHFFLDEKTNQKVIHMVYYYFMVFMNAKHYKSMLTSRSIMAIR